MSDHGTESPEVPDTTPVQPDEHPQPNPNVPVEGGEGQEPGTDN